jgi:hypothetical protein
LKDVQHIAGSGNIVTKQRQHTMLLSLAATLQASLHMHVPEPNKKVVAE